MFETAERDALDEAECLRLLASVRVGRIAYTDRAMPAILPVNFAVRDGAIFVRTGEGGKLAVATRNAVVAFQADNVDRDTMTGWTVVVVGHARVVKDKAELAALAEIPLHSWVPAKRDHFIRISVELVTGHRNEPPP